MIVLVKLQYDGTRYAGLQKQKNARTIQGEFEKFAEEILNCSVRTITSGRTDAGVHARGQVFSFTLEETPRIPADKLMEVLNTKLGLSIHISHLVYLDENNPDPEITEKYMNFSARFDANSREYSYTITNVKDVFSNRFEHFYRDNFDIDKMNKCAEIFIGTHDFTSFSKINKDINNYICTVEFSYWEQIDPNRLRFHIKANRFVYSMVRSLVGAMIDVGRNKRTVDEIRQYFTKKERYFFCPIAAPGGLVLEKVFYDKKINKLLEI